MTGTVPRAAGVADVALAVGGQLVIKCGGASVGHRRCFTDGRPACHRRLRPLMRNGQHLRRRKQHLVCAGTAKRPTRRASDRSRARVANCTARCPADSGRSRASSAPSTSSRELSLLTRQCLASSCDGPRLG